MILKRLKEECSELSKENIIAIVFILVLSLLLTMANEFFIVSKRIPFSDLGVYQYIGCLLNQGKFPYVDAFDHKGPILYLLYAIGTRLSVGHGMWFINYVFMVGTLAFSYLSAKKFVGPMWSLLLCLVVYSEFINMEFLGGTPEFFAMLFIAADLYILTDYYKDGDISNRKVLLLGLFTGCAFWLKHLLICTILIICFFVVIDCAVQKDYKKISRYLGFFICGFGLVSASVIFWVLAHHAGKEMFFDYFIYNLQYGGRGMATTLNRAKVFLSLSTRDCMKFWLPILLAFTVNRFYNSPVDGKWVSKLFLHTGVSLAVTVLLLALPGRDYLHYTTTLFPIVLFWAAIALYDICKSDANNIFTVKLVCIVVAFLMVVFPNLNGLKSKCNGFWTPRADETQILADIKTYAHKEDTIIIQGFYSFGLYAMSGHNAASVYPYGYRGPEEERYKYKKQIAQSKPALIICKTSLDPYHEFGRKILSNYYLVDQTRNTDPYFVYVRKDRVKYPSPDDVIKHTVDINSYLDQLSKRKDCTVLFAVKDIQGYKLDENTTARLKKMGFDKVNVLLEHKYHTFIGVLSNGVVKYQHIGGAGADKYNSKLRDHSLHIESKTWNKGNKASICIDGKEWAVNKRGINIVVFSNTKDEVIDSVAFDTHNPEQRCFR